MTFEEFQTLPKGKKEQYVFNAIASLAAHLNVSFDDAVLLEEPVAPNAQEGYTEGGE